jgi:ribosomal protein L11 methyltransferase
MYSLELTCKPDAVDFLIADLWEAGTIGVREDQTGEAVQLVAGFSSNALRRQLLDHFAAYAPAWRAEKDTDWVQYTRDAWPGRLAGERFFLCPAWRDDPAPAGRIRLIHNPGLACGTGEHPCTRMAIEALEGVVFSGCRVADIGTGSGILAIAARQLGAGTVAGIDPDEGALSAACENFGLNDLQALLAAGSASSIRSAWADVTVANISGTVLLQILEDLQRITKTGGRLILTGFTENELPAFTAYFPQSRILAEEEWRCLETATS